MKTLEFIQGPIEDISNLSTANGNNHNGAESLFIGRVRGDILDGKTVQAIEFTAHIEIAQQVSARIIEESQQKFGINEVNIMHSLGNVETGKACFIVQVKSPHRKEAFDALPWIVNEIKLHCPIFGKELFENGTYVWKKNKPIY